MKPIKPRSPEGPHAVLALLTAQVAASQGEGPEAGVAIAADFLGLSRFTLYKFLDPDQKGDMSVVQAAQLTAHYKATALAEFFSQLAGGSFLPVATDASGDRFSELTGAALQHVADVARNILEAHSPKSEGGAELTRREALALLAPLGTLLTDVSSLIALARARAEEAETASAPARRGAPR